MAGKKVGELIKEARGKAGLSQESLARQIEGLSASDVGRAERGEKELTQAQLRAIAKATGVTQKSLLEAAAGTSGTKKTDAKKTAAKKTDTKKTESKKTDTKKTEAKKTEAKKTETKKTEAKKTGTAAKKTAAKKTAAKKTDEADTLTNAEKSMLNAWRKADPETRKAALALLKGEKEEAGDLLSTLLSGFLGNIVK